MSTALPSSQKDLWAKTVNGRPGISVLGHCLNVGCVADSVAALMPTSARELLPKGYSALAALHDVGKISMGFLVKCPTWLEQHQLIEAACKEKWSTQAESDHAIVSQLFLQKSMAAAGAGKWAVAAGVHHGRIFGTHLQNNNVYRIAGRHEWEEEKRRELVRELCEVFGPLPVDAPREDLADLWLLAGLITVADWIGSNEFYFPADHALPAEESRRAAKAALDHLDWGGGEMIEADFPALFGNFQPNELQVQVHELCESGGLIVVEAPMGCGKTEAALWAAHRLIASGRNQGLYFTLPTQITSNRIFERVGKFLMAGLKNAANFRLAHAASWLQETSSLRLHPAVTEEAEATEHVARGRSWFASARHALLARYGVGTIDQALLAVLAVKRFFVRRFALAGKVVVLDEIHSYDIYTGALITRLIRELLALRCTVIVLSATLTRARREELLGEAGALAGSSPSPAYPLITVARPGEQVVETALPASSSRTVQLNVASFSENEILTECVERAEGGQHVLYLRNTVAEAQETFRACRNALRSDRAVAGLLHSRFPYFRREQLEEFWLNRLGRHRGTKGAGSLLVATQVVEQSVDIDLDFIVSDLAPTDMLLQRMGRLWRHERIGRAAPQPEFWINTLEGLNRLDANELRRALGKSGRVYAPYVLLRTAEVWAARASITLPTEIRDVLEATYSGRESDPAAWQELHADLKARRREFSQLAASSTQIFNRPLREDDENLLTRYSTMPTLTLVLLRSCNFLGGYLWRVTGLNGEIREISSYDWSLASAQLIARNQVRVAVHTVPRQEAPGWLALHTVVHAAYAVVAPDGTCNFPDAEEDRFASYDPMMGLQTNSAPPFRRSSLEDEDDYGDEPDD